MEITTTSEKPFQSLAIDVVGPLSMTFNGNKFIITMQDELTKFSFTKATPNHEAETVANSLLEFITIYGIPESILSDQGSDFTSDLMKELTTFSKSSTYFRVLIILRQTELQKEVIQLSKNI
ncbi:hypothetical protein JTB14_035606 [Gonioctena quinquepunctata]|nr:hypothetical protein JTB14_035606 [Gonioctena quinquepunctata]